MILFGITEPNVVSSNSLRQPKLPLWISKMLPVQSTSIRNATESLKRCNYSWKNYQIYFLINVSFIDITWWKCIWRSLKPALLKDWPSILVIMYWFLEKAGDRIPGKLESGASVRMWKRIWAINLSSFHLFRTWYFGSLWFLFLSLLTPVLLSNA